MHKLYTIALYIDPGTGSMLISALIATLSVVFFALKSKFYLLFSKKGDKGARLNPNKHYQLIYYSEGSQYWNVFKPLLEEGSRRNISATYLTSDREDPGLEEKIKGVEAIYIGSGREAYYNLNNLNADLVVMTTPGLDVLEIKRSKNVKHYSHITHATSSSGSYKAFATDYFDSVLVGGKGEVELIRELERKRKLPRKDIQIIGHTYLDVLRDKIDKKNYKYTYFKEKKKTVLISPTWGNHGLLTKYGDELLENLDKSKKYNVIIRPHPQSFISEKELMDDLMKRYPNNKNRIWDRERENLRAMSHADIMISDFSGIIFDYYTLFKKPILTISSQFEKRGREAMDLEEDPWDLQLLDKIGKTLEEEDLKNITSIIDNTMEKYNFDEHEDQNINEIMDKYPQESAERGIDYLGNKLKELEEDAGEELEEDKDLSYLNEDYTLNLLGDNNDRPLFNFFRAILSPNFLLQAAATAGLLLLYIYIGLRILPNPGLNIEYLIQLKPYIIKLFAGLSLISYLSLWFAEKGKLIYIKKHEPIILKDFLFILLPLTPVVQYIFANQDILKFGDSLIVLSIFALLSAIIVVIIPYLLSPLIAKLFTLPLSAAYLFILFNMASFGRTTGKTHITLIMILIIIIGFILLFIRQKNLVLLIIAILLIVNSGFSLYEVKKVEEALNQQYLNESTSKIFEHTEGKEVINHPDIFIMIYDSYANQETHDAYGYDNSEQINFLLDNNFAIYDGTYSIGADSLVSMSQVLNVGPLSGEEEFRSSIAGEATGLRFLKDKSYKQYLISDSDYLTKGYEPQYDTVFPSLANSVKPYKIISTSILEGEFRFDVDFSKINHEDLLIAKERILSQDLKEPEFLYHHINKPSHSQNSGVLLPDETQRYIKRLEEANEEMKKDIRDMNLEVREAIIIIAGDHGPYLTKNGRGLGRDYDISDIDRLDIQDRFGAFLAIHWPDPSYATKYDIKTIQDVLPAVISYMYEDDSLFDKIKMSNIVESSWSISRAGIDDSIIKGGIDDGKPLFENRGVRILNK